MSSILSRPSWPIAHRSWGARVLTCSALVMTLSWLWLPSIGPRARAAGTMAPDFALLTPEGRRVRLSSYHGRPVLLNFFSTTCEVSAAVVANLNALQAARPDLVVISVNLNQASPDAVAAWGKAQGVHYLLLADPGRRVAHLYRPYATPFWVFIQADGRIAAVRLGEHAAHNLALRTAAFLPPPHPHSR